MQAVSRRTAVFATLGLFCLPLAATLCVVRARTAPVSLFPRLRAGQVLLYQISYRSDKHVKTEGPLIVASAPRSSNTEVHALLRLEILGIDTHAQGTSIRARTSFDASNSGTGFDATGGASSDNHGEKQATPKLFVEFTLLPNGHSDRVAGLDSLPPEQQEAWQEWASRFWMAATFPANRIRVAQKWHSEEAEQSPSPIAGLRWTRDSVYVRDEACRPLQLSVHGDATESDVASENCAVILTTAMLRQPRKDSTPEDFKLHNLRTSGTASGKNRIFLYISLETGLLVRATEESDQQMDVTVAKSDASNRVHYAIQANSRSQVVMVNETQQTPPAH